MIYKMKTKNLMGIISALCAAVLLTIYCSDPEFDSPFDSKSENYAPYKLTTNVIPSNSGNISRNPTSSNSGTATRLENDGYYKSGARVTVKANAYNGYRFTKWSGASTAADSNITVTMDNNKTLTANFIPVYTVTYNGNDNTGGTVPIDVNSPYDSGSTVTMLDAGTLEKTDHSFDGWNTAADGSGTPYAAGEKFTITGNVELYAQWVTYTVTYDGNDNTDGTVPIALSYAYNTEVVIANVGTLVKINHVFTGWNTAIDGSGISYDAEDTLIVTDDVTLYARWVPMYTVIYNGNGNTSGEFPRDDNSPYDSSSTVTVLDVGTLEKRYYTFDGWNAAADGSGISYKASDTFNVNSNVKLYAQWMPEIYTIEYNLNDGIVTPENRTKYTVETPTFTLRNPTKDYHTFNGWTGTNGTTPQTSVPIPQGSTGNKEYTANWTVIRYSLTVTTRNPAANVMLTVNGSEYPETSTSIHNGGSSVEVCATANSDYTFVGWSGASTLSNSCVTIIMSDNRSLMANFKTESVNINTFTDERDGQLYYQVLMSDGKWWMAENLNYDVSGSICPYSSIGRGSVASCERHGRLYDWNNAMSGSASSSSNPSNRRGICPSNWHLPSDAEWVALMDAVGSNCGCNDIGTKLKSPYYWNSDPRIPAGTDDYGFSALPAGNGSATVNGNDTTFSASTFSRWWSTTDRDNNIAYVWEMHHDMSGFQSQVAGKSGESYSVRCVRND